MIRGLTSRLENLEMEGKNVVRPTQEGVNRPQNQYRRPFQPQQTLLRERRNNDDQRIHPPPLKIILVMTWSKWMNRKKMKCI